MCARFTVFTEEEIIEMRSIISEVSRKFGEGAVNTGEIRPTNTAPLLMMDGDRLAPLKPKGRNRMKNRLLQVFVCIVIFVTIKRNHELHTHFSPFDWGKSVSGVF